MMNRKIRGLIFDMDNTLLQSRIDFAAMKREIFELLMQQGFVPETLPLEEHTAATLIELAKRQGLSAEGYKAVMEVAARHEVKGMEAAGLEPGVSETLVKLQKKYVLAIVTNNAEAAARRALQITGVLDSFDVIAAREQMTALKPSPSGYEYVLQRYPELPAGAWLSVGDSWLDGKGSAEAGIPFLSYKTPLESMRLKGVKPIGRLLHFEELLDYLS